MIKLKTSEQRQIKAGATISATLLNALIRGVNAFMDIGRYLGSSIRRITYKSACPLK